jgi:hypothetical protein
MKNNRSPKTRLVAKIPPPPGPEASYDEIIAYHSKYTLDELERAGYTEEPSPEEVEGVAAAAAAWLLCRKGLHLKLARKDYEQLARLAAREDVAVEDLVKKWIKQRLADGAKRPASAKH